MSQRNSRWSTASVLPTCSRRFQLVIAATAAILSNLYWGIERERNANKNDHRFVLHRYSTIVGKRWQSFRSEPRESSQYCPLPSCFSIWRWHRCPDKYHRVWEFNLEGRHVTDTNYSTLLSQSSLIPIPIVCLAYQLSITLLIEYSSIRTVSVDTLCSCSDQTFFQ